MFYLWQIQKQTIILTVHQYTTLMSPNKGKQLDVAFFVFWPSLLGWLGEAITGCLSIRLSPPPSLAYATSVAGWLGITSSDNSQLYQPSSVILQWSPLQQDMHAWVNTSLANQIHVSKFPWAVCTIHKHSSKTVTHSQIRIKLKLANL